MKIELASALCGWLLPAALPVLHITVLWYFWERYHFPVNRATCSCECWDSIFKGPYESGLASYKNVYFNATKNTIKIWLLISTGLLILYECNRYLAELLLRGKLRFSMVALFLASIFPHYYSWWTYINYLNDDFYEQWNHQMFFTVTELISTALVLYLSNVHHEITQFKLLMILSISTVHLIAGGADQFFVNLFMMEGLPHQVIRDFGLMIPDMLHIAIPIIEIYDVRCSDRDDFIAWYKDKSFLIQIFITAIFVSISCYLVSEL